MKARQGVAVLGATGVVGQRLIAMLDGHPWFDVAELVSARSAGAIYRDAISWVAPGAVPERAGALTLIEPGTALESRIVFSALGAQVAHEVEPQYAAAGHMVVSNASAFRADPAVPLVIPEINPDALALLDKQQWAANGGGIVTNPNCTAVGLTLALAPLYRTFGITSATVVTMQALSGAGLAALDDPDLKGNVVPFIHNEEDKIAAEPLKILDAEFPVSVSANRVPVTEGHTMTVFVKLGMAPGERAVAQALSGFRAPAEVAALPSSPKRALILAKDRDHPQPRMDMETGGGMSVVVGPVQPDPVYDARFTVLVHNLVRGAAGAALLNAELFHATRTPA